MTPIDDLNVGDFVAVVGCKRLPVNAWGQPIEGEYHGKPYRILEICLPFLCVAEGEHVTTIDVRQWEVQRVSKRYAKLMESVGPRSRRQRKKDKPDPRNCPRCGCRMRQEHLNDNWRLICPECKWDGGLVETQGFLS